MGNKDKRWGIIWLLVLLLLGTWNFLFLNKPAFHKVLAGLANTFMIVFVTVLFTFVLGWTTTFLLQNFQINKRKTLYLLLTFFLNIIRSIPQVVGILLGYIGISLLIEKEVLQSTPFIFLLMAFCISLFIFLELVDLMQERISHFQNLDFYNAMRVCGISENRIIHFDILWKNSRIHIFNKLISILGSAVFLQCSVDFIVSVGLSTEVNAVMLPTTLGSLLAKIDSKQDILAIGYTLTHPLYFGNLFFTHLQGITLSFLIVFSLLCLYHIANGFAERHRL